MACKKYTITNNTNKIGTYSYQECSELIYVNDSQIQPGQTKNIWARDNTFNVSEFLQLEVVVENFPDTQANTGPCSDVCSPALFWYNPNLNRTHLSIYDYVANTQFFADPYFTPSQQLNLQISSGGTVVKYRSYISLFENGTAFRCENFGPYNACPFQVFNGVGSTNKLYTGPRTTYPFKLTYGVTEESWFGEDPVAKQVVYLTGTTVTAQTPSTMVELWSWNFPVGMDRVVGQIKTFFAYGGVPRVWTMYQSTSGTYTLVRNLWSPPNTQEFSYNLPGSFTVNGEKPIGIWLTPFSNVLIYTNYNNVYEFDVTTSSLSFLQAAPNPFQGFQPGWTPLWLGQPWTCDIPPASPTPTNTPTQTSTPTSTSIPTVTPTLSSTLTPTPTTTSTSIPTVTPTLSSTLTPTPTTTSTPTSTSLPTVTPTLSSTLTPTATETPTPTPTETSTTSTPTPTETMTPTPTPTCVLDQCYQFVSVEITGATTVYLTSCDGLYTHGRTLTASTYPDTVRFRFEFCFEKDSLVVLSGSTPVSVVYDTDCCLPVSPTPTSTESITPTPTATPTVTPSTSEVPLSPTPTSTESITPTPTPTCAYSNLSGDSCFHYAAVTLSGATQMRFDLCFDGNTTSPRTLTASTYPSTVLLGPTFQADCFVLDSYEVLSGSTPIAVEYFNPCCEPVSSCDGCYEYSIYGGFGSGSTWNVSYCSGGTENLLVPGYSSVNVCVTERPYKVSGSGGLTLIDCCGTPVTPTPTPTSTVTPTVTSSEGATPTPTSTEVPVTPTPTSTEVPVTPTPTSTVTPTVTSSEGTTPTPTSTEVPVTPTPTPTCGYGGCFHYAAVTLSGATIILFDLCGTPLGNTETLTASTYPSTVLVGPLFEDDCFSGDSYTVLSGSTPIAVEYFNPCCEPVSSCDGCYEYNIDGGEGSTKTFNVSYCSGGTENLSVPGYTSVNVCVTERPYLTSDPNMGLGAVTLIDCCGTPVTPTPTPTSTVTPTVTSSEGTTPTPTSTEVPVTPTPTSTPTSTEVPVTPTSTPTSSEVPVTPTSTPTSTEIPVTPTSTPTSTEVPVTPTPTSTPCSCIEYTAINETDEGGSVEYLDCDGGLATLDVGDYNLYTFCACSIVSQTGNVSLIEGRLCIPITPSSTPTQTPTTTPTSTSPPPTPTPSPTACNPFSGGTITNTVLDTPDYSTGFVQFGYVDNGTQVATGASSKGSLQTPTLGGGLNGGTECETNAYVYVYSDTFGLNPDGVATVITVNLNGTFLGQVQGPFQGDGLPANSNTFYYTRVPGDSIEVFWDSITSGTTPTPTATVTQTPTPTVTETPLTPTPTPTPTSTVTPTTSLTPTPSFVFYEFTDVGFDETDPTTACSLSATTLYSSKVWTNLTPGSILYTDSGLTTPLSIGGVYAHTDGVTRTYYEVNDSGVVTSLNAGLCP